MSELFREIEEDIKREHYEKIWQKYGRLAMYASVVIIIATAGFVTWNNYTNNKAEQVTSKLLRAIELADKKEYKEAIPIFSSLADDDSSPYYPIAMLKKAQAQEQSGDMDGAQKTYKQLSGHSGIFADLVLASKVDTESKLAPTSFNYSFIEKKAWQELASGNKQAAIGHFSSLFEDEKTPRSLASRAEEVLRVIAPEKLVAKTEQKKVANE